MSSIADVPHRYCANHFSRDVAKPVLDADSYAKVQMRKKVRGLRTIEQAVLQRRACPGRGPSADENAPAETEAIPGEAVSPDDPASSTPGEDAVGGVVLDDCTAVRGILNNDQGGPLHPPGLQMAEALKEVEASIQRNLDEKKGAHGRSPPTNRESETQGIPRVLSMASTAIAAVNHCPPIVSVMGQTLR